jgi:sec-independent protein translocase protein TatA
MGLGGINIWQLLIILAIVVVLFGTKKLRGMGGDLGGALKGFKKAMSDDEKQSGSLQDNAQSKNNTESDKKKDKV